MGKLPELKIIEQIVEPNKASRDLGKYGVAFGYAKQGQPFTPMLLEKQSDFVRIFGGAARGFDTKFYYAAMAAIAKAPTWCMRIADGMLAGGAIIVSKDSPVAEVTDVTCVAEAAISQGDYFTISSPSTTYQVWFDIDAAGTNEPDDSADNVENVKVSISTADTANDVADAVATALDAEADFSAPNPPAAEVTVTNANKGVVLAAPNDVSGAGFTFDVDPDGFGNHALTTGLLDPNTYVFQANELFLVVGKYWGQVDNNLAVTVTGVDATDETFVLSVYRYDSDLATYEFLEEYEVSRNTNKKDGFGRSQFIEDKINGKSAYINVINNDVIAETVLPEAQATQLLFGGGDNGSEPAAGDIVTALDYLSDLAALKPHCFPDCGYTTSTIQQKIESICETAEQSIAVLSIPWGTIPADAITHKEGTGIDSKYSCWYYPNLSFEDVDNDISDVPLYASSAMQPLFLDPNYSIFQVPIGDDFKLMGTVERILTESEAESLADAEINPVRYFTGVGNVVETEFTSHPKEGYAQSIAIRLLLNYVKRRIRNLAVGFRFKYLTPTRIARFQGVLKEERDWLVAQEAILETSPDPKCDLDINDLDSEDLNAEFYMSPTRLIKNLYVKVVVAPSSVFVTEGVA